MKMLFAIFAVLLICSTIDAAPRPKPNPKPRPNPVANPNPSPRSHPNPVPRSLASEKAGQKGKRQFYESFAGNSFYPSYFLQHPSPFAEFQNSFLQAAFLPGAHYDTLNKNFTDSNGKPLPLDAKSLGVDAKNGAGLQAKLFAHEGLGNVNIVNPFLAAKDADGKLAKADNGLPAIKVGKLGEVNGKTVSLVNPYHGSSIDPVFGPEIAPRYEIHYAPAGYNFSPVPSYGAAAPLPPISPFASYGPVSAIPQFASYPSFGYPTAFGPYPAPFPVFPHGFDPKNLKPNGKDGDKKPESETERPTDTSTESFQETSPIDATTESLSPSDSSSEPTSEPPQ